MQIGDKDKDGNALILGGWKADLYQIPDGNFLIDGMVLNKEEALLVYNKLNNTSLLSIPSPPKEEGIALPVTQGKVLGIFESKTQPGVFHHVIKPPEGHLYCTCTGFLTHHYCWHTDFIKHIGLKNITGTIIMRQKKEDL